MENNPHLDADTSQLVMSSRGKCSVPIKNLEVWEKRARKFVAINSCAFHRIAHRTSRYVMFINKLYICTVGKS